ncbi:Fe-only nitrogenase accessory AnfO family protein [Clostridium saccharoperbutylacetonicum]|uniref:Fe-only nitrogenase accessory AnfO family protein n=1 Tax=Clostridium saccharoperbutylacetonicum TaxID=36745 RepID=UPI0009839F0B|nr:Fe-only nitrogenase accessory AnfO family protein [Clostridium saccharoperbutylacetonicum]AQR95498.1 iron only nitrogenase protein AnfO [Clostridium saccharoperbutylacetonicum]NSB31357.1 Fe-only nitrogenase accessory protein AnfO [Clostridium saccharoperbutylacetonicum]
MNEIGVFLDEQNFISSFEEAKLIKVFVKEELWKVKQEIKTDSVDAANGLNEVRKKYKNLINKMDDCKIILVKEAVGIPYSVFYTEDFSIWELEGDPLDYLDEIIRKEQVHETEAEVKSEFGKELDKGYYLIDMHELEITNPEISSKKAIIPYLDNNDVKKIEVHCCHVPPWLVNMENKRQIKMQVNEISRNDYRVLIQKNN